ncbi:MAG TPA: hypothetical protein VKX17_14655 [Planctomycetota bacterium]|nr:hypothetical protein [Planctomycetota bacterium]
MRKVAVARCAFVVLTLSMIAASGADKTVTDKDFGFQIVFPLSWAVLEKNSEDAIATGAYSSKDGRPSVTVKVYSIKEGITANDFFKSRFGNIFFWRETGEAKVGNMTAYKAVHEVTQTPGDGWDADLEDLTEIIYCIVAGKRGYVITSSYEKHAHDKYAKDIDAIVKSFKLIEAK